MEMDIICKITVILVLITLWTRMLRSEGVHITKEPRIPEMESMNYRKNPIEKDETIKPVDT